jgi:hypothetical protein
MAWSENKIGSEYNTPTREFICDSREDIELLPEKAPQVVRHFVLKTVLYG